MSASKKRKISGLSGLELELSLVQLRKLRKTIVFEDVLELEATETDTLGDELDKVIALLETRTKEPLSLSFSAVNETNLGRLNITQAGMLFLQDQEKLRDAIESTRQLGATELWSNGNMYRHLSFLSNTYNNVNEASSRMFIDAFFFRTTAMVPSDQRVVIMLEKPVPSARPRESKMDTVSGVIDYTALVADARIARMHLRKPPQLTPRISQNLVAFFTAEAKASDGIVLEGHTPRALVELVACAKHLGKSHIRGALTSGDRWIFLAVNLDREGEGATYWESEVVGWRTENMASDVTVPVTSNRYDPALIAGILSSWVPNSFSEFDGDQWFYKSPLSDDVKNDQGPSDKIGSFSREP
ncbi:hypothetical protein CC1G_04610 [Coprinopsis cinerea okayama7|uniref:Uncharacterized protein n=1 Tax=Coprinopsis cinerea (strain Okayama-7 / 130 / ATCC MYA-4618 / FGSC 9003) TaxID=240176 RepID=A8N532_COPC7|nr:hypothetical protein CC1G_04610 [Coprinopsis cinerea okayama7\|eukprot:XP_001829921.1 hypothetical protein CC1G_04610 [Coprinopsis cinerea okayama7\